MIVDLGTGSGQAVLRRARENPTTLVIGIDADARAMADSSRRAAAAVKRGGVPNAIFLAAPAEELPGPLARGVDLITIALPWGSLMRAILTADAAFLRNMSGTLKPEGQVELLISATERDAAAGMTLLSAADAEALATRLRAGCMEVLGFRTAGVSDVDRLSSAWARRLRIPGSRAAWIYVLRPAQVRSRVIGPSCRRRVAGQACRETASAD